MTANKTGLYICILTNPSMKMSFTAAHLLQDDNDDSGDVPKIINQNLVNSTARLELSLRNLTFGNKSLAIFVIFAICFFFSSICVVLIIPIKNEVKNKNYVIV